MGQGDRESARQRLPRRIFFFKQKTAYEIGLGIPAEPLFRSHSTRNKTRDGLIRVRNIRALNGRFNTSITHAYSIVIGSKHITLNATGGGFLTASGGIQGDVLATDNNTVGRSEERRVGKKIRIVHRIAPRVEEPFCFYQIELEGTQVKEPIWFASEEVELLASREDFFLFCEQKT